MKRAISYLRASLDAENQPNSVAVQRAIVQSFAERNSYELVDEYFEYDSGCNDDRTLWNEAICRAEAEDLYIVCWRVDRFSRSLASFAKSNSILGRLRFCELGDVEPSPIVLSMLIAVGQNEAMNTRVRISETMRILKERDGRIWGNPNIVNDAHPRSLEVRQSKARAFNSKIQSVLADFRKAGYSLRECVSRLNDLGITTRRGKRWTYPSLYRVANY